MSTADGDAVTVLYRPARMHPELWIPAGELDAMNAAIVGRIEVIADFRGERADDGGSGE